MANSLAFIDELQGATYQNLSSMNFKVGIIDPDDAKLTTAQVNTLHAAGKSMFAYLSIGEAESYRSYWNSTWNSHPPSFLMGQNPDWAGNYNVKYWDPNWQSIIVNRAVSMAKAGYQGIMMDVVDAYTVSSVAAAAGGIDNARTAMEHFVEKISAATKAVNPNFKIIQNNALDLLTTNPDDPASATNTAYMSHIDGVLAESTFYDNNAKASWSSWNTKYLDHAVAAGKTVLSIDYPTNATAQQDYIKQATAHGYVPYVADLNLDNHIASVNYQVPTSMHSTAMNSLVGSTTSTVTHTATSTTTTAAHAVTPAFDTAFAASHNVVYAQNGNTTLLGTKTNMEFVFKSDYHGNATIKWYGSDVGDVIDVAPNIFSSTADALKHVSYSNGNAIINLNGHGTITVVAAGDHSLTAHDFHIG